LLAPQPVEASDRGDDVEPKLVKSEEPDRDSEPEWNGECTIECRAERETDEACPPARASRCVELMALRAAKALPTRCCVSERPVAAPRVNIAPTATATSTVAPRT
jgi:hypothetical protein